MYGAVVGIALRAIRGGNTNRNHFQVGRPRWGRRDGSHRTVTIWSPSMAGRPAVGPYHG